jgi:hypothetical protein
VNFAWPAQDLAQNLLQDGAVISLDPKLMDGIGHLNDDLALGSIARGDAAEPTIEFGAYSRTKQCAGLLPKTRAIVSKAGLSLTRSGKVG